MIKLDFNIKELPKEAFNGVQKKDDQKKDQELIVNIQSRIQFINECILKTLKGSENQIKETVDLFCEWMVKGSVVRLIGAGRARLAGAVPMNRLSHGGARLYINDDNIPMPHSIHGGGIIAVSASGKTESVLKVLRHVRESTGNITIVGIASKNANEFKAYCDVFIGIDEDVDFINPLTALADTGEQLICQLLDAIVVAAGKKAMFDDTRWRLGHEDIGSTGPYGVRIIKAIK